MKSADRWRPTAAHARAVLSALVLAVVAVLARRPDMLVLATPFAGAAVWAVLLRPTCAPEIRQSLDHSAVHEGEATTWRLCVHDPEGRVDDVAVALNTTEWTEQLPVDGQVVVSLRDDSDQPLAIGIRTTRWGHHRIGPARVAATSAWAGFRWVSGSAADARMLVALPQPSRFDASTPPVHTPGLVGVNRSPQQNNGTEFASIRPFQTGDRLRRIHWPQSLRTGTLHVTSTWADHDRHVVLFVDALSDVGESGGVDGRPSSLDIAVRAAGAIAEHYVSTGDGVALVLLDHRGLHRVPPATGRRHLRRLLDVLATARPARNRFDDDGRIPRGLTPGALVVMLSPLASPAALQRAVTMANHGLTVLVVDCLPPEVVDDRRDPHVALSRRIRSLEREREVRRVGQTGIAVVSWRGPGSLDEVLRDLKRHAGPRIRARS